MNLDLVLAWLALTLWAAWLSALQGVCGHGGLFGVAPPDLSVILCLALVSRVNASARDGVWIACALGRCAVSSDPPLAVLAGFALIVLPVRWFGPVIDLKAPLARGVLAFLACLALEAWLGCVMTTRAMGQAGIEHFPLARAWQQSSAWLGPGWLLRALSTGVAAALLGRAFSHLFGLKPLHRRRLWGAAGS